MNQIAGAAPYRVLRTGGRGPAGRPERKGWGFEYECPINEHFTKARCMSLYNFLHEVKSLSFLFVCSFFLLLCTLKK